MKAFAALLERLAFTPARNAKLQILQHYLERTPDPDRGWALAALTGDLELRRVTPGLIDGDLVQITEGLASGEEVVTRGALFIDRAASGDKAS